MIFRTRDEINEAIATQKATVERIIIREANKLEDKLNGVSTFDTAEEFLASLDELDYDTHCPTCDALIPGHTATCAVPYPSHEDIHTLEPPC